MKNKTLTPSILSRIGSKQSSEGPHLVKKIVLYSLMVIVALFSVGPFLWILATAFKGPNEEIYKYPPSFIPHDFTFHNFVAVLDFIKPINIMNSLVIALGGTVIDLLFCSLAAYPLARYDFPGKKILLGALLMTLMLPLYTTVVVNFITITYLHMTNSLLGVIIPTSVTVTGLFLLRQGYLSIPKELEDAGRVDGASEFRIWWQIMLPLIKPSLAALVVFDFVNNWNSFLWPLIVLSDDDKKPVTIALQQMQHSAFASDMRLVASGTVLSIVPILIIFLMAQRYFISGSLAGSVKG